MKPLDFIATAKDLTEADRRGRPRETNLRRAISTTYYALFHCLATCCADMLVGSAGANRSRPAWRQTYRALQHGTARRRCRRQDIITKFPVEIQDFAKHFIVMQGRRHQANYDPYAVLEKVEVVQRIAEAKDIIHRFTLSPARDRRAFAVYVLLDIREE